jgi:hypothetical protein
MKWVSVMSEQIEEKKREEKIKEKIEKLIKLTTEYKEKKEYIADLLFKFGKETDSVQIMAKLVKNKLNNKFSLTEVLEQLGFIDLKLETDKDGIKIVALSQPIARVRYEDMKNTTVFDMIYDAISVGSVFRMSRSLHDTTFKVVSVRDLLIEDLNKLEHLMSDLAELFSDDVDD